MKIKQLILLQQIERLSHWNSVKTQQSILGARFVQCQQNNPVLPSSTVVGFHFLGNGLKTPELCFSFSEILMKASWFYKTNVVLVVQYDAGLHLSAASANPTCNKIKFQNVVGCTSDPNWSIGVGCALVKIKASSTNVFRSNSFYLILYCAKLQITNLPQKALQSTNILCPETLALAQTPPKNEKPFF